jgi:drug/metabolite transporter (DMT)-like permease
MEKCKVDCTPFSLLLAMTWAVVCNAITYFSIKALSLGSISNYSLFLMAGGMVLPTVYGVFFGDSFGVFKILGIAFVLFAVLMRVNIKEKADKKALLCFFALFLFNGSVGIISSLHQSNSIPFERISATQFSLLRSLTTIGVGAVLFGICPIKKKENSPSLQSYAKASPWAGLGGLINGVAYLFLLLSLKDLQPSMQYPIITGGCIFLSAISSLLLKEKITLKDWIAVSIAVIGTIFMFFT